MKPGDGGVLAAGTARTEHDAAGDVTINNLRIDPGDAVPTGRQLLSAGGFDPASDHVLILLLRPGSRSIGLDETVDLRRGGAFAFRAFQSDRAFSFILDERGYEWGAPAISEVELRDIGIVPDNKVIVLERDDHPDMELEEGDEVRLSKSGTERLRTRKSTVTVIIDNVEKEIPRGVYTTEELIEVLGVEAGYVLDVVKPNGQLEALKPGQKIRVRKGMKFISQAPCGGSS